MYALRALTSALREVVINKMNVLVVIESFPSILAQRTLTASRQYTGLAISVPNYTNRVLLMLPVYR